MAADQPSTATEKEHKTPNGASHDLTWTGERGQKLEVEVLAEWMVLRKKERPVAEMFHTYYRATDADGERPITFVFNGGPGAASAYLHIGGLSPQRIEFGKEGQIPPSPAKLVNNLESWIEFTDLVFVDPIGTGFSRAIETPAGDKDKTDPNQVVKEKEFYGVKRDLETLGEFIERFLSKHKLWHVPVVIAGESYGGFRTAKLARQLQESHGVGLRAAIAISPALEFSLLENNDYDVLRTIDTFCAMALAAVHHKRSRALTGTEPFEQQRATIEQFATVDLAHALIVGAHLPDAKLKSIFARTADFLGLPTEIVARAQGRVPFWQFARELLRDQRRVVGWYDASITGIDPYPDRDQGQAPDPTLVGIGPIFESGINQLLRGQIGIESERKYIALSFDVFNTWSRDDLKHGLDGPVGSVDDLRFAMSLNPHMRVLICHGYYDLITPYYSSDRLVDHMKLLPEQRAKLEVKHFTGGHMFYTWDNSRKACRDWVRTAIRGEAATKSN